MLLRPTHSRVIMAAAITGRDSTARSRFAAIKQGFDHIRGRNPKR
jgi:hypothetical protein